MTNEDKKMMTSALYAAAHNRGMHGATRAQIDYIVSLTDGEGEKFDNRLPTTLTKKEAHAWIDRLINPIIIPNYVAPTKEQVEEKAEDDARLAAISAGRQAQKDEWIAANYPDYADLPSKKRKKIRHAANNKFNGSN